MLSAVSIACADKKRPIVSIFVFLNVVVILYLSIVLTATPWTVNLPESWLLQIFDGMVVRYLALSLILSVRSTRYLLACRLQKLFNAA